MGKDRINAFAADTKLTERIEPDAKGLAMIRTKKNGLVPLDQWLDKQLGEGGKRSWFIDRNDADNRKAADDLEQLADEACTSLAAQGRLYKIDPVKAAQLLAERGLALGQLGKPKKSGTEDHRANPWSANYKGGDAEAERVRIIQRLGTKAAQAMAKAAGADLAGRPLK